MSSDWVSERRHLTLERGRPVASSPAQREHPESDAQLPKGASLIVTFVLSLGLWAGIWALIALFA